MQYIYYEGIGLDMASFSCPTLPVLVGPKMPTVVLHKLPLKTTASPRTSFLLLLF